MERFPNSFKSILTTGRDKASPWSFFDLLALTAFIFLFASYDPFRLGDRLIDFLRLNFFIFTKEPRLLYYSYIYINTFIFKGISLVFLIALVKYRRVSFRNSVLFCGRMPAARSYLVVYAILCVLLRLLSADNPLVPNIPLDSVFTEARIIGNAIIIFSVIVVAPLVEELLFRGFLYPALNKYMGIYPSIVLTSILFTAAHYPQIRGEYLFMGIIFFVSLMITYARAKTGSTWFAIILHHIYNLAYVLVGFVSYAILRY